LCKEFINKCPDMLARFLGHRVSIMTDLLEESIERMPAVRELPEVDAGGIRAKPMTAIGVEEDDPVVKLFPEHDARVG
jgi:hypothetical protein